jgi:hypothetical protein
MRRITVLVLASAIGLLALAGAASADPINAKNTLNVTATCDGQTVDVVVIGNGDFTPAHVVGSTEVFVPTSFDLTFMFTTPEGETFTDTEQATKPTPTEGQPLVTCSIDQTQTSEEGTFHLFGTVTGFFVA